MKKSRLISIIVIIIAIVVCGYLFFGGNKASKIQVETAKVAYNSISNIVSTTGTIEPITQVEVGTQVSGKISKIYVDYNSVVKKGDLIAELERVTLESEMRSQMAQLSSAKTEYEYQLKNYNRDKVLHEKQLISDTDFETTEYNYKKSKDSYERLQADVVKVKQNLSYAMIYSPIDGVVLSKAVEEGQTVASSFNTPTLFTIANDLTKMRVIADVDESDIGSVEEGQRVTFTVDACPGEVFNGEVTQVRLEAKTTSNVVTYEVVVNAPNPDLKLKPGLTATVTIYTMEKDNILTIPVKSLKFTPNEELIGTQYAVLPLNNISPKQKTVWIIKGNQLVQKEVSLGTSTISIAEVKSGLNEGDMVVVGLTSSSMNNGMEAASSGGETSPFMPKRPGQKK